MIPDKAVFQKCLDEMLDEARNRGDLSKVVRAGDLHKKASGYPKEINHHMRLCCRVMKENKKESDEILPNDLKEYGASFQIRYNL